MFPAFLALPTGTPELSVPKYLLGRATQATLNANT
jgi:hypothetical protein